MLKFSNYERGEETILGSKKERYKGGMACGGFRSGPFPYVGV